MPYHMGRICLVLQVTAKSSSKVTVPFDSLTSSTFLFLLLYVLASIWYCQLHELTSPQECDNCSVQYNRLLQKVMVVDMFMYANVHADRAAT